MDAEKKEEKTKVKLTKNNIKKIIEFIKSIPEYEPIKNSHPNSPIIQTTFVNEFFEISEQKHDRKGWTTVLDKLNINIDNYDEKKRKSID